MRLLIIILITASTLGSLNGFTQDMIYLKNNEQIKAKVTMVDDKSVLYKRFENLNGPEYKLAKKEITIIVYENGTSEQYNGSKTPENNAKNVISMNFGDLTVSRLSFSYERFIYKQKLSLKIPLSVSYNNNYYYFRPKSYTGLDLNFYPLGLKHVSYFTGIGTQAGIINNQYFYPYYDYYGNTYYSSNVSTKYYTSVYVNNGITIIPIENFSISGQLGIGVRDIEGITRAEPSVTGQLNVSVRF